MRELQLVALPFIFVVLIVLFYSNGYQPDYVLGW